MLVVGITGARRLTADKFEGAKDWIMGDDSGNPTSQSNGKDLKAGVSGKKDGRPGSMVEVGSLQCDGGPASPPRVREFLSGGFALFASPGPGTTSTDRIRHSTLQWFCVWISRIIVSDNNESAELGCLLINNLAENECFCTIVTPTPSLIPIPESRNLETLRI